jgi:hypothetical protein
MPILLVEKSCKPIWTRLVEPRLVKASKISASSGIEHKMTFSSIEITGENKSNVSVSIVGFEEVKRFEKWEMKLPPMSSLEDTQIPESNFRKFNAFALILIRVEVWKYLVLRSLRVSHVSLDFDLYRDSSFTKRLSKSSFKLISLSKEEGDVDAC